jgi:undecaprenyl-diphosphatase
VARYKIDSSNISVLCKKQSGQETIWDLWSLFGLGGQRGSFAVMHTQSPHSQSVASKRHVRSERFVLILGFVSALCVLLFFAWLAEEMMEGDTAHFDATITSIVHEHATARLTTVMKALTMLGSSVVMTPLAILTLALCYFRREFHALKTLAVTFGGALLLELILKLAFHRPRPVPFFDLPTPASFSFPSGHTLFSFCFFAGLAALLSPRLARGKAKLALWGMAIALTLGIGLSRIYLGVHYPSDVLAGYAAGIVWVATVKFVNELHHKNVERESSATGSSAN